MKRVNRGQRTECSQTNNLFRLRDISQIEQMLNSDSEQNYYQLICVLACIDKANAKGMSLLGGRERLHTPKATHWRRVHILGCNEKWEV